MRVACGHEGGVALVGPVPFPEETAEARSFFLCRGSTQLESSSLQNPPAGALTLDFQPLEP